MPQLSIIIPVYNAQNFLSVSVESILNQTFSDWELILINDGSTDDSLSICRAYADKDVRIKVIDKENGGAGSARNAGLEIACGEYISFIDADDWLDSNAYEILVDQAKKTKADLILFGIRTHICDKNNQIIEVKDGNNPAIEIMSQEEFRIKWASLYDCLNLDSGCNKLYKASIIRDNQLKFPDLRRMQDGVFNMYYYEHVTSFISLTNDFYNRRWNYVESQRKKIPQNILECALTYYETSEKLLKDWGLYTDNNKFVFINKFVGLMQTFEFVLLPKNEMNFWRVYQHVKKINNHTKIHRILKEYKKLKGKISRRETAMLYRWNLLLAFIVHRQIKRG